MAQVQANGWQACRHVIQFEGNRTLDVR